MGAWSHLPFFYSPRELTELYAGRSNSFDAPEDESSSDEEEEMQQDTVTPDPKKQVAEVPEEEIPVAMGHSPSAARARSAPTTRVVAENTVTEESETDSGNDSSTELETSEVNKRLEKLKDIEARMDRFGAKLERAETVREKLVAKLVIYVWLNKVNKEFKFDRIGASKYRTSFGIITESLMKLLCELDDVQSRGNATIRTKRRALVKRINNELLPKADRVFLKANKLVKVTEEVLGYSDAAKKVKQNAAPVEETPQGEPMEMSSEPSEKASEEPSKMEFSADEGKERKTTPKEKREQKSLPKFETSETSAAYIVRLRIPAGERARDVRFALDSNREMTISGKTFSLPVEIDPRKAILQESTYEFLDSRTVMLRIPKRKRRVPAGWPRQARYNPGFNNFGYQQNHRPTVWGW